MTMAPLVCACGAILRLLSEHPDTAGDPCFVGLLLCDNGHRWVDIRDPQQPRLHLHASTAPLTES